MVHEVALYKYLGDCENIVKFMGYDISKNSIFLELYDGDANNWRGRNKKRKDKEIIVKGMIDGLNFMHEKKYIPCGCKIRKLIGKEKF